MSEGHLDDLDAEERRVGILVRREPHAAGELAGRAHPGGARDVDVDVLRVLWIDEHRVRVRAAAGLYVADVFRIADVADIEDAETAEPVLADSVWDTLRPTVEARAQTLTRDEEEVPIDRNVALRCRAEVRRLERRRTRVGDIPHLIAVVIALDRVGTRECQVGVHDPGEVFRRT